MQHFLKFVIAAFITVTFWFGLLFMSWRFDLPGSDAPIVVSLIIGGPIMFILLIKLLNNF